jgi:hypothetical protein
MSHSYEDLIALVESKDKLELTLLLAILTQLLAIEFAIIASSGNYSLEEYLDLYPNVGHN